jgi:hypothetical protein
MRDTPPTPVFYGQIHFGTFRDPFEAVNLVEADIYGHKWAPRWWRNFRLKEWYRLTILTDDLCCEIELFDTKVMALSSVFIYDRTSTHPIEHQRAALQRGAIQVPEQPPPWEWILSPARISHPDRKPTNRALSHHGHPKPPIPYSS